MCMGSIPITWQSEFRFTVPKDNYETDLDITDLGSVSSGLCLVYIKIENFSTI